MRNIFLGILVLVMSSAFISCEEAEEITARKESSAENEDGSGNAIPSDVQTYLGTLSAVTPVTFPSPVPLFPNVNCPTGAGAIVQLNFKSEGFFDFTIPEDVTNAGFNDSTQTSSIDYSIFDKGFKGTLEINENYGDFSSVASPAACLIPAIPDDPVTTGVDESVEEIPGEYTGVTEIVLDGVTFNVGDTDMSGDYIITAFCDNEVEIEVCRGTFTGSLQDTD